MSSVRWAAALAAAWVTAVFLPSEALAQQPEADAGAPPAPVSTPAAATTPTTPSAPSHPSASGSEDEPETPVRSDGQQPIPGTGAPPPEAKPVVPEWMRNVTLGGGVVLWYYQPIGLPNAQNDVSIFFANLLLDGKWGIFGLHLEPRFRDTKLRPFFDGPVWLQEAYASIDIDDGTQLRIGKTYSHLGLFWDNSFYGNVQVYDGLKLDPDYGLSIEANLGKKEDALGLGWWAQYFVVDGGTNVSLPGRDTISITGARRRNMAIARLEPHLRLGDDATLALGASGEYFQAADLPTIGTQDVFRVAGDAKLTAGKLGLWGEFTYQSGRSVNAFPIVATAATATSAAVPGQASATIDYLLLGAEYTIGPVTARYNASLGNYSDLSIYEWMHVPAVGVAISPNLSVLAELVLWTRYTSTGSSLDDRSLDVTVKAHL